MAEKEHTCYVILASGKDGAPNVKYFDIQEVTHEEAVKQIKTRGIDAIAYRFQSLDSEKRLFENTPFYYLDAEPLTQDNINRVVDSNGMIEIFGTGNTTPNANFYSADRLDISDGVYHDGANARSAIISKDGKAFWIPPEGKCINSVRGETTYETNLASFIKKALPENSRVILSTRNNGFEIEIPHDKTKESSEAFKARCEEILEKLATIGGKFDFRGKNIKLSKNDYLEGGQNPDSNFIRALYTISQEHAALDTVISK